MPESIGFARPAMIRKRLSVVMDERLKSAWTRLLLGQRFRQQEREEDWRGSYRQYMANNEWSSYSTQDETADLVNINISFSTINTLVPFLADEDPTFLVEPDSEDATTENGAVLAAFMNRIWRSIEVQGKLALGDSVFDNLVIGDGFMKPGYEIVNLDTFDELGNLIGEGRIRVAEFSVDRISPWDIWLDPYSDGIHNARWVCHRILVPAHEIKDDPRYKIPDKAAFEGTDIDITNMSPEDQQRVGTLEGWVTIYEFYDIKEKWMISMLPGGTQIVRYLEQVKCPIVQIPNYRIPNSPYHMGELEQIRSLQLEINKTRSQMMTHRRRNVLKWVVNESRLSEDALEAMRSSKVNDVIKVKTNEPIENIIQAIAPVPLSGDSYAIDDRLRADVNEITGVNEYLRGVPQNISRTATEASIIEGATNIRTRHKLLQVETAARQAGQILLDIIRDVLPTTEFEEMTMFITGTEAERLNRASGNDPAAGDVLLTPNPEVFDGRYRVEVERGSTELRNPQVRAQQLMQMTQLMLGATPTLQQLGIPFNMKKLLEMWFEAEGIKDVDALFESDEQQTQMQDLALQERQAAVQAAQEGGGISGTPEGQSNRASVGAPQDIINPSNSGMLPSREF
jgi:hypothetical protein